MVQELKSGPSSGKIIVGLTGGFGCGKTTVAHLFEELGAFMVDADKLAHEALMAGSPVYEMIREAFGEALSKDSQEFDVKRLAGIIFSNPEKRKKLESIVHPYVFNRITEEVMDNAEAVAIVEAPLLFESGYDKFCNSVIVVTAPDDLVAKRLREKGFTPEEIAARRSAQMPLEKKVKKADFVIDNSETFQQTRREVESLWKKLRPASKGVR